MPSRPSIVSLVPFAHVASVSRSMEFYGRLGFEVHNTFTPPGEQEPVWASMKSGQAQLMLGKADEPVVASQQAVLFYLYCEDVAATRVALEAAGVALRPHHLSVLLPRRRIPSRGSGRVCADDHAHVTIERILPGQVGFLNELSALLRNTNPRP